MPRKTKKETLALAQDQAAPFLFDESNLPVRNDLVALIQSEAYKHTGARLLDNEAKALRLVELLMAGWGVKRIAKEMHVAGASVRAARKVLVSQGKMDPYKQRVVALFEDIVEVGSAFYLDALERGLVAPGQIPVGVGIISDKRALALGEPTSIGVSAAAQLDRQALSVEALNSWVDGLGKGGSAPALDVQSTVSGPFPPDISQLPAPGATLGATCPPISSPPNPTGRPTTDHPATMAARTGEEPGPRAGGGSPPEGAAPGPTGSDSENPP